MNAAEAAIVLAKASAYDRRTIGEADALAWAEALYDVAPVEATRAVAHHYRTTSDWLMPSHVMDIVRANRERARITHGIPQVPSGLAWQDEQRWRYHYWEAARAGELPEGATEAANAAIGYTPQPESEQPIQQAIEAQASRWSA